jgi:hypothetical protein
MFHCLRIAEYTISTSIFTHSPSASNVKLKSSDALGLLATGESTPILLGDERILIVKDAPVAVNMEDRVCMGMWNMHLERKRVGFVNVFISLVQTA